MDSSVRWHFCSVSLIALLLVTASAWAEPRNALVIGNGAYQHVRQLTNPGNDAGAIAAKLKGLGFSVILRQDAGLTDMKTALRDFVRDLPEGGVALVYYAGHGMQVKGTNYLIPVDAQMAAEFEVPDETLSMDSVLRGLDSAKSALNILVLDCCRNDPYSRSWRGARSTRGGGLVVPADMPSGMFIAFATSPGSTAEDGDARHSPYTAGLLMELDKPGADFERIFKNVGARVVNATQGRQEPWYNSKFYGSFSFANVTTPPPSLHATPSTIAPISPPLAPKPKTPAPKVHPPKSDPITNAPAEIAKAIPVPGKPGFVTSPSGKGGYIDVRGFPSGTEVKDPYSGTSFIVP